MSINKTVEVSALSLATILNGYKLIKNNTPDLTVLIGELNDDGILCIYDAFETLLEKNTEDIYLPTLVIYDSMITTFSRFRPRNSLVGFASCTLTEENLSHILKWCVNHTTTSRFVQQRRLKVPIGLMVTPLTKTTYPQLRAFSLNDNEVNEYTVRYKPFVPYTSTQNNKIVSFFKLCEQRINKALELTQKAISQSNYELAKECYKIISVDLIKDFDSFISVHCENRNLFYIMTMLANTQIGIEKALRSLCIKSNNNE